MDFDDKIINELIGKEKCLHDMLSKSSNDYVKKLLNRFEGESEFDIKIQSQEVVNYVDDDGNIKQVNGKTSSPVNNLMNIYISTSKSNLNLALSVARTILHEYIHADIFRKLNTKFIADGDLGFKKTYEKYESENHHNVMAELYLTSIRDALKEFHQNELKFDYDKYVNYFEEAPSDDFYEALAWSGLIEHNVKAWVDLSPERKAEINNLRQKTVYLSENLPDCN